MTWTRRSFTTSLAAGLLAAPFCRLIGPARAQTPPTRRLLIFARRQPLQAQPTDLNRLVLGMIELIRRTLVSGQDAAAIIESQ